MLARSQPHTQRAPGELELPVSEVARLDAPPSPVPLRAGRGLSPPHLGIGNRGLMLAEGATVGARCGVLTGVFVGANQGPPRSCSRLDHASAAGETPQDSTQVPIR